MSFIDFIEFMYIRDTCFYILCAAILGRGYVKIQTNVNSLFPLMKDACVTWWTELCEDVFTEKEVWITANKNSS